MLTPDDIRNKQFTMARFGKSGYDQQEVDDFLDQLETDYAAALRAAQDATNRLKQQTMTVSPSAVTMALPPVPAANGPSLQSIALLLQTAQQAADKITADAAAAAAQAGAEASAQAVQIVAAANTQAVAVAADAEQKRNATIGAMEMQRSALADKIAALQATHTDIAAKLTDALAKFGTTP